MKYLDVDWGEVIGLLEPWQRIPLSARRTFLEVARPSLPGRDDQLGSDACFLYEAGLLARRTRAEGWSVPPANRSFCRVILALGRNRVFDGAASLEHYMGDHFSYDERCSFGSVEHLVGSAGWLEAFESSTAEQWERDHLDSRSSSYFVRTGSFDATRELVRRLKAMGEPVELGELAAIAPGIDAGVLPDALRAAVRYCLCFPALREGDLLPVVGIWPAILREISTPPPPLPRPLTPDQTFHAPLLVHDVVALITECAAEPIRLRRGDGALFARTTSSLAARLHPVPAWCGEGLVRSPESRIWLARMCAEQLGVVNARVHRDEPRLETGDQADAWLGAQPKARLHRIMACFTGPRGEIAPRGGDFLLLYHNLDLREGARRVFESLGDGVFLSLERFVAYHATQTNPYLELRRRGQRLMTHIGAVYREPSSRELAEHWARWVEGLVAQRLFVLDGLIAGTADGELCVSLTDAGRYYLGLLDDFAYDAAAGGEIVVQPNFEIVFLTPDPYTEGRFGRFSERVGEGVGVLFRITRQSVYRATASGLEIQDILGSLEGASRRPLPANVAGEIAGWHGECRRVGVEKVHVIRSPDAETSGRIAAALGSRVESVTDSLVVLRGTAGLRGIRKRLQEYGIFMEEASEPSGPSRSRRSRRRR